MLNTGKENPIYTHLGRRKHKRLRQKNSININNNSRIIREQK